MLPKANRMSSGLFKLFNGAVKGEHTKHFFIQYKDSEDQLSKHRFGIVVSKKISNKAVVRNSIKRKIRVALRTLDLLKETNTPKLFIIHTKKGGETLHLNDITKELGYTQILHNL